MAIVAEISKGDQGGKSTVPAILFNPQESADSTLPNLAYPFRPAQSGTGFPVPKPENAKIHASGSGGNAAPQASVEEALLALFHSLLVDWMPVVLEKGAHSRAEPLFSAKELESLLTVVSAAWPPTPILSVLSNRVSIESALDLLLTSVAQDKVRAVTEAAQAITRAGASAENVDRAIRTLLSAKRSGGLDDATDILTLLGGNVVRSVVETHLPVFAPDGSNDDYWYVLIRAAGRTGDREIPKRFLESRLLALEEAAVLALGDIGDFAALEDLRRVVNDSRRPQIIRELAEELVSDLA